MANREYNNGGYQDRGSGRFTPRGDHNGSESRGYGYGGQRGGMYGQPRQEYRNYRDDDLFTEDFYDSEYDAQTSAPYIRNGHPDSDENGGRSSRNSAARNGAALEQRTTALLLTAVLAAAVIISVFTLNSYSVSGIRSGSSMGLMDTFHQRADKVTYAALGDILGQARSFYIPDTTVVCPKPDINCYGSSADDAVLSSVISSSDLARGVSMVWHEGIEYHNGVEPVYYSDPSILSLTWKVCDGVSVINFSEVIVADGSQFKRFLCDNTFGTNHEKYATTMSESVNAVLAMNGDFYIHRQPGVVVYQGKVYRNNPQFLDHCFIDEDGDMLFKRQGEIGNDEEFQKFVDDNKIRFSLSFGPVLVEDHKAIERIGSYNLGEVHDTSARAAVGLIEPRHYLLCLIEGGKKGYVGADILKIAKVMEQQGCEKAYTVDGGQTAVLIVNNKIYNRIVYDAERQVSDIIYFATAAGE